ncbi:hypothetical protein HMPREF0204_13127 [Chryseobacterium gleum ATCC 35910]|uniref:Uncharacterized protein n=1 Tax=Chryseobacterium gleum ATCC 35910 TaxID=525257 RepID=A0ABN0ALZ0_CHRGE|nr:hypothetical protein HMPREF0204_13127 [Chryseobacterium gleum ATCC 35910]
MVGQSFCFKWEQSPLVKCTTTQFLFLLHFTKQVAALLFGIFIIPMIG